MKGYLGININFILFQILLGDPFSYMFSVKKIQNAMLPLKQTNKQKQQQQISVT